MTQITTHDSNYFWLLSWDRVSYFCELNWLNVSFIVIYKSMLRQPNISFLVALAYLLTVLSFGIFTMQVLRKTCLTGICEEKSGGQVRFAYNSIPWTWSLSWARPRPAPIPPARPVRRRASYTANATACVTYYATRRGHSKIMSQIKFVKRTMKKVHWFDYF